MTKYSTSLRIATAAALSFALAVAAQSVLAKGTPQANQPTRQSTVPSYGPWTMGPGMMYHWTPEQRRQYREQMGNLGYGPGMMGYGPGMMGNLTPEQRQQHWEQMRAMMGYGP
jgi:Spy/CpxP family protein refolding chaperone